MRRGRFLFWIIILLSNTALAERYHRVKPGENLAKIAHRYNVPVREIVSANGLEKDDLLRDGKVLIVPPQGVVYVRLGQTLSRIARNYNVSVTDLAKQNRIKPDAMIREGQRLVLPGYEAAAEQARSEKKWGRPKHPGVVTLFRVWSKQKARIRLIDRRGRVTKNAVQRMKYFLRSKKTERRKSPDRRLLALLARVSDHFGGRTINIISGYREAIGRTKLTSRHVVGRAIDFRIRGVATRVLADYCRKFDRVGVGYYPKSGFVHLDVRKKKAFWTDLSGPGEAPKIKRKTHRAHKNEISHEHLEEDHRLELEEKEEDTGGGNSVDAEAGDSAPVDLDLPL